MMPPNPDDQRFMRRAIALSKKGYPAPNPHVGCVLTREGRVVGEGFHRFAGAPHAEAMALDAAGPDARGATAYVTLEPCNHFGRTPPCAQALIRAGVSRVVVAVADPNPKAAGGLETLRAQGIECEGGLLAEDAASVNRVFLHAMTHRRPYVVVKAAASLDGRIALPSGESQWITSPKARREGHRLRAELGAVLVGRRTVELDDPELTARLPGVVNQPLRIVLDPAGKLSGREKVFNEKAPTRHVTGAIDLPALLAELHSEGVIGLLVEGGAVTIASFLRERLIDGFELFLGPKILGDGPAWIEGVGLQSLSESPILQIDRLRRLGPDIHLSASFSPLSS